MSKSDDVSASYGISWHQSPFLLHCQRWLLLSPVLLIWLLADSSHSVTGFLLTLLMMMGVGWLVAGWWFSVGRNNQSHDWLLSEQGELKWFGERDKTQQHAGLKKTETTNWQLMPQSRTATFACLLVIEAKQSAFDSFKPQRKWLLVTKDSVDDASFRRIARVVNRVSG